MGEHFLCFLADAASSARRSTFFSTDLHKPLLPLVVPDGIYCGDSISGGASVCLILHGECLSKAVQQCLAALMSDKSDLVPHPPSKGGTRLIASTSLAQVVHSVVTPVVRTPVHSILSGDSKQDEADADVLREPHVRVDSAIWCLAEAINDGTKRRGEKGSPAADASECLPALVDTFDLAFFVELGPDHEAGVVDLALETAVAQENTTTTAAPEAHLRRCRSFAVTEFSDEAHTLMLAFFQGLPYLQIPLYIVKSCPKGVRGTSLVHVVSGSLGPCGCKGLRDVSAKEHTTKFAYSYAFQ